MIIGHNACGILIHYFTLPRSKPLWCTLIGGVVSDVLTGIFILLGIEHVRSNPRFTALGLDLVYIDYTHSLVTTFIWAVIWASLCHTVVKKKKGVWVASFLAVLSHWVADILVHKPDMPIYPNADVKYGLSFWQSAPVQTWIGELMLILIAIGLMAGDYGLKKARFPVIVLLSTHLLHYPGLPTNSTYALGNIFPNHPLLLRVSVGLILAAANPSSAILISRHLDKDDENKAY